MANDDLTNLNEPKSYREMFQKIMWMMEQDREDRADDREMLEGFVTKHQMLMDAMDIRVKSIETCQTTHKEKIDQLEKKVNTWSLTNTLTAIGAFITAIFLKGS